MEPGAILRLRNLRAYGTDPRNFVEFRPDDHKAADLKKVFLVLYLGQEMMQIVKKGRTAAAQMNPTRMLNLLGWFSGHQLDKAKAPKKFLERLRKVVAEETATMPSPEDS